MSDIYKKRDLVGCRFGMLTVVEDSGERLGHSILWRCRCDCGGEILAVRHSLVSGVVENCGCVPRVVKHYGKGSDLSGRRFGQLTVVGDSGGRRRGCILWECRCDCGGEASFTRSELLSGNAQNCGCVLKVYAPKTEAEDLSGRRFGALVALFRAENDARGRVTWFCRCDCGREITATAAELKSGHTRSCGCQRYKNPVNKKDLSGKRFGRLVVVAPAEADGRVRSGYWHCRCDCGRELDVCGVNLTAGRTRSCGCLNSEQSAKIHEHMTYRDNTCVERLKQIHNGRETNKAGFRGLFVTKDGKYRATITFQGVHYYLGCFSDMAKAVRARLDAEAVMHDGYVEAYYTYLRRAEDDPAWAAANPFYYTVSRVGGEFTVSTNGVA